jgi:hypothetical protein
MVNVAHDSADAETDPGLAAARARLVNSGQDTKITFRDGSTIVLKGVTQVRAFFPKLELAPGRTQDRRQLAAR